MGKIGGERERRRGGGGGGLYLVAALSSLSKTMSMLLSIIVGLAFPSKEMGELVS